MEMNSKGQAAVTDALYFLLIITFLSVFLFGFANSYGNLVREQVNDEYNTAFTTNALKTILYSSTPRDPMDTIYSSSEVDYLLALIKEDYSDDLQIDFAERKVFGKTILSVLSPIQDTKDYIFYIHVLSESENKKMIYFFIHSTNFEKEAVPSEGLGRNFFIYSANETASHNNFFCGLTNTGDSALSFEGQYYIDLIARFDKLRANIGSVSEANSSVTLVKETDEGDLENFNAEVNLMIWDATWLGETDDRPAGLFYQDDPTDPDTGWGCEDAELF